MSITVVISGPKASEQQVRTALAGSGLSVHSVGHDFGLPEHAGEPTGEPQAFVSVDAPDVDVAGSVAATLGWRLRLHFPTPEEVPPSREELLERMADLEAQLADLRSIVHGS